MRYHKTRQFLGIIVFIIAVGAFLFAVWKYDISSPKVLKKQMTDLAFHSWLLLSISLFYAQWKISQNTWLSIRKWFAKHIWSIMFATILLLSIQFLMFLRWYNRDYNRFRRLLSEIQDVESSISEVKDKIEEVDRAIDESRQEHKPSVKTTSW